MARVLVTLIVTLLTLLPAIPQAPGDPLPWPPARPSLISGSTAGPSGTFLAPMCTARSGQPDNVITQGEGLPEGLRLNGSDTGTGWADLPDTGTPLATLRQRLAKPRNLRCEPRDTRSQAGWAWRQG